MSRFVCCFVLRFDGLVEIGLFAQYQKAPGKENANPLLSGKKHGIFLVFLGFLTYSIPFCILLQSSSECVHAHRPHFQPESSALRLFRELLGFCSNGFSGQCDVFLTSLAIAVLSLLF